ncbi:Hypothetical protein DEACI_1445 [Acididesulfobacillus acetoxydans]|uniref:Uncharacterized protein n=1 Tax=Acididesulfobacillus acetoxydans TaxID=1561005 RepID=A0A8S0WF92_9FIRM|nr:hypothetical protein [Acididesulfobacillus acetoxydans]CAA7600792.1 Hypothetical protein DEACI_1445 [Acididesulfobacillus acetoxydans]CEJ08640.1 Hypothetical protein DEACI_3119 [Acididesulfobacillus acetoxydans]
MIDLVNVHLSKDASAVVERMEATVCFDQKITAAKFALAYAIKNHFDEIDPERYALPDGEGSNFNFGTLDPDGQLSMLLRALYPGTNTPYLYARALMVFGLMKLDARIEREGLQTISALM